MTFLIDERAIAPSLPAASTLADALAWAQSQLAEGTVVTRIELDGIALEGEALVMERSTPLANRRLAITTSGRRELALSMLGKLAAFLEWLGPQHREVAALLERGDLAAAFPRLGGIFSGWHQVQQSYSGLAKLLGIALGELPVRGVAGEQVIQEFCRSLADMHKALESRDLVMLADILQYEMDGVVANWMAVLEATLAIVEPQAAAV